jgi:hypothetical protein
LQYVQQLIVELDFGLVVFDTLTRFWPVDSENNAPEVNAALLPLHATIGQRAACLLVTHSNRRGSREGGSARGSGALPAFADIYLELQRTQWNNPACRRRLLIGEGRNEGIPARLEIELPPGGSYRAVEEDAGQRPTKDKAQARPSTKHQAQAKAAAGADQEAEEEAKFLAAFRKLARGARPVPYNDVANTSKLSRRRADSAYQRLRAAKKLVETDAVTKGGHGAEVPSKGVRKGPCYPR